MYYLTYKIEKVIYSSIILKYKIKAIVIGFYENNVTFNSTKSRYNERAILLAH